MNFLYRSRTMVCSSRWGKKVVSVHGIFVPVLENDMHLTMGKKASLYMDFVYHSRRMTCSSRWERSSLCTWTLCLRKKCTRLHTHFVYYSTNLFKTINSLRTGSWPTSSQYLKVEINHWYPIIDLLHYFVLLVIFSKK